MKQIYQRFIKGFNYHTRHWVVLLCAMIFGVSLALLQTGRNVRGTVTDEKNQPLLVIFKPATLPCNN